MQMADQSNNLIPQMVSNFAALTKTGLIGSKRKQNNQDNHCEIYNFVDNVNMLFTAVMDGHGLHGHDASSFVKDTLSNNIASKLVSRIKHAGYPYTEAEKEGLKKGIQQGFLQTNRDMNVNSDFDVSFSGTTCVCVIIRGNYILCANIGDSRAIACK